MYFVVSLKLKENRKNVVVPMHWCNGIDMGSVYNCGIQKSENLVVFYSKSLTKLPNFNLPIRGEFVKEDSCYLANYRTCESKCVTINVNL